MPRLPWLADAARATGYPVTEVQGWETRGTTTFNPKGLVWHHTAGAATGDMPSLGILINGRSGLPGPLSQYGLGRSGRIYVVAAGRANHAGSGGWNGLTGNGSVVGIEAEHVGKIPPGWPTVQLDSYRKLSAEILRRLNTTVDFMCGHKEWAPDRKVDPISVNMTAERGRVRLLMEGDDMDVETVRALAREPIIQVLQQQTVAWYRRLQAATGVPGGNADFWGTDFTGSPRPSMDEWHAEAVKLHSAALSVNASGMNDAQVRQIALETGKQVFVEKGTPVVIRGS